MISSRRVVVGVDPGMAHLGFGIVREEVPSLALVEHGTIETDPALGAPERLLRIHDGLAALIDRHRPTDLAIEDLFFNRNARSALRVGEARGVVLFLAAARGLSVAQYTPLQVKQALTGYGRARKEQIQEMVRVVLGLRSVPRPDHAADALALAICHIHTVGSLQRYLAAGSG